MFAAKVVETGERLKSSVASVSKLVDVSALETLVLVVEVCLIFFPFCLFYCFFLFAS